MTYPHSEISNCQIHAQNFCDAALVPDGPNYQIKAVHSGKCLDVAAASHENGGNVQQWNCDGVPNQKWVVSTDDGSVFVK